MAYIVGETVTITATTAAAGNVQYTAGQYTGLFESIEYTPSTGDLIPTAAEMKVETESGGIVMLTSAVSLSTAGYRYLPRVADHTTTGGEAAFGTTGGDAVREEAPLLNERIKFTSFSTSTGSGSVRVTVKGRVATH